MSKDKISAADTAAALAKVTSATAEALAAAKAKSDVALAVVATNIEFIKADITEIKQNLKDSAIKMEAAVKELLDKDEHFVLKEDFIFWRNILISGILLTIASGVVLSLWLHLPLK